MKNREKYKNELMDVIKKDGRICGFVKKHGVFQTFGKNFESFCKMTCVTCGVALDLWLDEEYKEPPKPEVDWSNVPVDTLVRVRDREDQEWTLRYFKGIDDGNAMCRYSVWVLGATSKTANNSYMLYKYCELVEDEDNGK